MLLERLATASPAIDFLCHRFSPATVRYSPTPCLRCHSCVGRQRRSTRDPSLRLKDGSVQDDASIRFDVKTQPAPLPRFDEPSIHWLFEVGLGRVLRRFVWLRILRLTRRGTLLRIRFCGAWR